MTPEQHAVTMRALGFWPSSDKPPTSTGSAPQRALPVALEAAASGSSAAESIDWSAIVDAQNAKLFGRPTAAPPVPGEVVSGSAHGVAVPASPRASAIDWNEVVAAVNADLGFKGPGPNVDPALAAHLAGSQA